ncbi:MAG: selenocysteine-specific translation elongation factor [Pseudoflavonifractor sp.]
MPHLIVGMAGHVDHGKTALTLALTGVDTDRLAEEKRRGLTIELGFAPLLLPDGSRAGLVDMPGHEKFIRTMVAGACGVDLLLLVVAADDGFMPQTREHLFLAQLLGIQRGIIVLTKTDLVSPDRMAQVTAQARLETAGTFLQDAPLCPVCAPTGAGLEALKNCIVHLAAELPPRDSSAPFRLSVDRVFSKDGFGTIVTGTALSGRVAVGDQLTLYPAERQVRVRALQSHGAAASTLEAGERIALNLADIEKSQLCRGDELAAPESLSLCTCADGEITLLPSSPFPVKTGSQLHFYCGTRELLCRCTLKNCNLLLPGQTARARLRFAQPLAARTGDRFVLRFFSPTVTVGGGILRELSPKNCHPPSPAEDPAALATALLTAYHRNFPLREGMPRQALESRLGANAMELLAAQGALRLRGNLASLPDFRPKFTPTLAALRDQIDLAYRRARYSPPANETMDQRLGGDRMVCRQVAERLIRDGVLVILDGTHRIHRDNLAQAQAILRALLTETDTLTLASYRDALGCSRKYALLLLDYWDKIGLTQPRENGRILAK